MTTPLTPQQVNAILGIEEARTGGPPLREESMPIARARADTQDSGTVGDALARPDLQGDIIHCHCAIREYLANMLQTVHGLHLYLIKPPCRAASSMGWKMSSDSTAT